MGWREPEPQNIGKVGFNRGFRMTEASLIRARHILSDSDLSRNAEAELANIFFDQAMETRPDAAWEALSKEVMNMETASASGMARNGGT